MEMFNVGTRSGELFVGRSLSWPNVSADAVPQMLQLYLSSYRRTNEPPDDEGPSVLFLCTLDKFDERLMADVLSGCCVRITYPLTLQSAAMLQHAKCISIGPRHNDNLYYLNTRESSNTDSDGCSLQKTINSIGCVPDDWAFSGKLEINKGIVLPKRLDAGFQRISTLDVTCTKTNKQLPKGIPTNLKCLAVTGYPHLGSIVSDVLHLKTLSSLTLHCGKALKITDYFPKIPTLTYVNVECHDATYRGIQSLVENATSIRLIVHGGYNVGTHSTMLDRVALCSRLSLLDTNLPFSKRFLQHGADEVTIYCQFMLSPSEIPELRVTSRVIPTWIDSVAKRVCIQQPNSGINALFLNNSFESMYTLEDYWLKDARNKLRELQRVSPRALMQRLCFAMMQSNLYLPNEITAMILEKVEEEFASADFGILVKRGATFVARNCDMTTFWTHS